MKTSLLLIVTINCLGFSLPMRADILELKNGDVLDGKYVGGTAGTVRFEAGAGMQVDRYLPNHRAYVHHPGPWAQPQPLRPRPRLPLPLPPR